MKKILLFLITTNISLNAQVGINKSSPTSAVDIVTSVNRTPLNIKDKNNELKVVVNQNGDFYFKNSLLIDEITKQNPGVAGQVLVSNGPNNKPSWINLDDSVIGNYLTSIVNAGYNLIEPISYIKNANTTYTLSFLSENVAYNAGYVKPNLDLDLDPTATGTNYLLVEKEGVYSIIVNGFIESSSLSNVTDFECVLYLDDYQQPIQGYLNGDKIQFIIESSRYLSNGDRIYLTLLGPSSWGFKEFNVLVNYVKADN